METGTEEIIRTIREDPFLSVMFSCYERAGEYAWDKNVLDYGCGYGWGSWWVAAWAREVTGYDPDRERIRFAQENFKSFKRENLSFTWNVDELEKGQYNMICLFMVISYIEEKEGGFLPCSERYSMGELQGKERRGRAKGINHRLGSKGWFKMD